jgi:hypothetical protein
MSKAVSVLGWLLAGHALLAALFWGLLHVPEANVAMLVLSAVLVALLLAVATVVEVTAAAWLWPGSRFRDAVHAGVRGLPALLAALVAWGLAAWLGGRIELWHGTHRGEIDAWLIARAGTTSTGWAHAAIEALAVFIRWIVGLTLAVGAVHGWLADGVGGLARLGWVRRAFSRYQFGLVALAFVLLIALPWQAADWRPAGLPPTWVEALFVAAKLAVLLVVAHVGWMIVLAAGASRGGAVRGARARSEAPE